jgi:AcrR family transcriptional regulator
MQERKKPFGSEAVKEAILKSAEELFSQHGASAVSIRDIARHANVNQGLIHRHFQSKQNLALQVMDRLARRAQIGIGGPTDLVKTIRQAMKGIQANERYFRLMARSLLDAEGDAPVQSGYPFIEKLVKLAAKAQAEGRLSQSLDPRVFIAGGLSQTLGLLIYSDYILPATGLDDMPRDQAVERIIEDWRRLAMLES